METVHIPIDFYSNRLLAICKTYFDNVELNEKTEFMFQEDESLPDEIQESNANRMKR